MKEDWSIPAQQFPAQSLYLGTCAMIGFVRASAVHFGGTQILEQCTVGADLCQRILFLAGCMALLGGGCL